MGVDRTANLAVLALASLVSLVGLAIVAAGATLLTQFASGTMIVQSMVMWVAIGIILIGLIILITALIAQEASNNFADIDGTSSLPIDDPPILLSFTRSAGRCTGKFRLFITAVTIFVAMCITGYVTYRLYEYQQLMHNQYNALQTVASATNSDDTTTIVSAQIANVTMSSLENTLAKYFDYIFSEAVSNCDGTRFIILLFLAFTLATDPVLLLFICIVNSDWFWYWVDDHCPSEIHRSVCMQCPSYTLTFCGADPLECQSNIYGLTPFEVNAHVSCAYSICRTDIVHFMQIYPFGYGMYVTGGLTVLYLFLWIAALILISCTRVRDKQHVQVVPMKDDDDDEDDDSVEGGRTGEGGAPGAPDQLTIDVHPVTDRDLMLIGPDTKSSMLPEQKRDEVYELPSPYPPMFVPSHQQQPHTTSNAAATQHPPAMYRPQPSHQPPYDSHMGQQMQPYAPADNYSPNDAAGAPMPSFVYDGARGLNATGGPSHRGAPAAMDMAPRFTAEEEQHQLALALALSQQTAAADQHQPNRQRFYSRDEPLGSTSAPTTAPTTVPTAAAAVTTSSTPTLTREQEDLQLAIALSASTAAAAAAHTAAFSSKAANSHNRSNQNLTVGISSYAPPPPLPQPSPTRRHDDTSAIEEDELQLALALSLSANQK